MSNNPRRAAQRRRDREFNKGREIIVYKKTPPRPTFRFWFGACVVIAVFVGSLIGLAWALSRASS